MVAPDTARRGRYADGVDGVQPKANARLPVMAVAAVLAAFVVLSSWAIASPTGSSPDDVYHLASIWCAQGDKPGRCTVLATGSAETPAAVAAGQCAAHDSGQSAACIAENSSGVAVHPAGRYQTSGWGQFYPPIFYRVMNVFVTDNVSASAIAMRIFNGLIALAFAAAVVALAPPARRGAIATAWLVTVVPMALFIIPSTNPQSWAIIGAATAWAFALVWREQPTTRRRAAAAIGCVLAIGLAASARFDATLFAVIGVIGALALSPSFASWARPRLAWVLGAIGVVVAFVLVQMARSGQGAFARELVSIPTGIDLSQLFRNFKDIPQLWFGNFGSYGGTWGLGQLDTVLPAAVGVLAFAAFAGAAFIGFGRSWPAKSLVVGGVAALLMLIPMAIFQRGLVEGATDVGLGLQPRYFLPLLMIFAGFAMTSRMPTTSVRLNGTQRWALWACLSVAHSLALYTLLRRYISGQDIVAVNLDVVREWWWQNAPSPQTVWIIATVAFSVLAYIVLAQLRTLRRV